MLREKPNYFDKKRSSTAASRLSKCAAAIRLTVGHGVAKLGRKTLFALIDHITQVLHGPQGELVTPLLQDYVKALSETLSRQSHVELISRQDSLAWDVCVDFFLEIASYSIPSDSEIRAASSQRASTPRLTLRSTSSNQSQKRLLQMDGGPLKDVLEGLYHVIRATNAPLRRRFREVTKVVVHILQLQHFSLGSAQTLCFSIITIVFSAVQMDELDFATSLVKDVVPLMSYWWRAEKVSQDELIRALRNEISSSLSLMQLHIEYLVVHQREVQVRSHLYDLTEPLWLEYSKRSEAFRMQLMDITFNSSNLRSTHFRLPLFGLQPHNVEAESHWALVHNLARLESVLLQSNKANLPDEEHQDDYEQPRKKRKMHNKHNRLRLKLSVKDTGMRGTALQMIPFVIAENTMKLPETIELLSDLTELAGDKNANTASWALIACARLVSLSQDPKRMPAKCLLSVVPL